MVRMTYYYQKKGNMVTVQNMCMGMAGQKHSHTIAGFKKWVKDGKIEKQDLVSLDKGR